MARDRDDPLLLKFVEGDRDPLPGRADDARDLVMRDLAFDDETIAVAALVVLGENDQQVREPLDDGTRSEHLRQRRIAFAFGDQAFNQADGERRKRLDQFPDCTAGQMEKPAATRHVRGPDVLTSAENLRPTDEVASDPIGERDLAARRGGVEPQRRRRCRHNRYRLQI